ncbi:MAG: tetratricopeptide repeat protein [Candidatus Heimdallarchaeaceae archaeon]
MRLSFVQERDDGTWKLHDLAQDLIKAELGHKLERVTDDIAGLLEKEHTRETNFELLGIAISVQGLANPRKTVAKLATLFLTLCNQPIFNDLLAMLDRINIDTEEALLEILTQRGYILTQLKRFAEAEHALDEALRYSNELVETKSSYYLKYLGRTYHFLAPLYFSINRFSDSEKAHSEALRIFTDLYEKSLQDGQDLDSDAFAWFGNTKLFYGNFLSVMNRDEEAEELYSSLLEMSEHMDPLLHGFDSEIVENVALDRLATVRMKTGKMRKAEETLRKIIGRLTKSDSPHKLVWLANAFHKLSRILVFSDKEEEAEEVLKRLLEMNKAEFVQQPETIWYPLSLNLNLYGYFLILQGRYQEAETVLNEALDIAKEYVQKESEDIYIYVLDNHAILLTHLHKYSDAEKRSNEALEICRTFVDTSPDIFSYYLVGVLNNQAIIRRHLDEVSKSGAAYEEALEIITRIMMKQQENVVRHSHVAMVRNNYAVLLHNIKEHSDAEYHYQEALSLMRDLVEKIPELFCKHIATILSNYGVLLCEAKRFDEAGKLFNESLEIERELAKKAPNRHLPRIVSSLNNIGIFHKRNEKISESKKAYLEAISIGKDLVQNTITFKQVLSIILCNYLLFLRENGGSDEIEEIEIYLKKIGITDFPSEEEWIVREEEL